MACTCACSPANRLRRLSVLHHRGWSLDQKNRTAGQRFDLDEVSSRNICAEKTRVEIHIFFASHDKCYAVMYCLWRHGHWALPITTTSLPPCLFNEQGVWVDF